MWNLVFRTKIRAPNCIFWNAILASRQNATQTWVFRDENPVINGILTSFRFHSASCRTGWTPRCFNVPVLSTVPRRELIPSAVHRLRSINPIESRAKQPRVNKSFTVQSGLLVALRHATWQTNRRKEIHKQKTFREMARIAVQRFGHFAWPELDKSDVDWNIAFFDIPRSTGFSSPLFDSCSLPPSPVPILTYLNLSRPFCSTTPVHPPSGIPRTNGDVRDTNQPEENKFQSEK